jgi:hypothetical protein
MSKPEITAASLSAALAAAKDADAVNKIAGQAIDRVAALEVEQKAAVEYNASLQDELDQVKSGKSYKPSFKSGKSKFTVLHGVNWDGTLYTPEEIAKNTAIQKKLIASGSSALAEEQIEVTE